MELTPEFSESRSHELITLTHARTHKRTQSLYTEARFESTLSYHTRTPFSNSRTVCAAIKVSEHESDLMDGMR